MSAPIKSLLNGLKNPLSNGRLWMLRVLAMLEETRALPILRTMTETETDPEVREVLRWSGALIWRARKAGYSTVDGMRQYFRPETNTTEAERNEEQLLAKLHYEFEMQNLNAHQKAVKGKIGRQIVLGAFGAALTGPLMGATLLSAAASPGKSADPDMRGTGERPTVAAGSVSPLRTTQQDTTKWVQRLHDSTHDPTMRTRIIIELKALNNPAALPALAGCYALDPFDSVKNEAQRAGKSIYFNWVYWAEYDARMAEQPQAKDALPAPNDIAQILAKAEAARQARRKKT